MLHAVTGSQAFRTSCSGVHTLRSPTPSLSFSLSISNSALHMQLSLRVSVRYFCKNKALRLQLRAKSVGHAQLIKGRKREGRGGEGEGGRGQEKERGRGIARERVSPSGSELFSRCNCATCKCICICKCCCCCCRAYLLDTLFAVVTEVASSCCNTFLRIPIALGGWRKAQRRSQATPSELVATNVSCSLYHFIYFLGRCSRNGTRKTTFDSAQSVVFLCIFCSIFFLSLYVSFSGHIRHLICDKMKLSLSLTSRNSSSRMFMHARDAVSCSVALHSSLTVPLSLSLPLSLLSYSLFNYHKRQFCNRISVASWAESASRG